MELNRTIKKFFVALLTSGMCIAAIAEECEMRPVEEKVDEYAVYDSDGGYKGYVALGDDGIWFAWVEGQGARNERFDTREQASNAVCNDKE